jgi:hypothetical protein
VSLRIAQLFVALVAFGLAIAQAEPFEVTCGEIANRRTAHLAGDCTGSVTVVFGTLYLDGHTISGTGLAAITCEGRCRIEGPGTLISSGSTFGISGDGSVRVADVTVQGHEAAGIDAGELGRVRLDGVTLTDNGVGVSGARIRVKDSDISNNSGSGIVTTERGVKLLRTRVLGNGGDGVTTVFSPDLPNRVKVVYSTVTGNGHFGVLSKSIVTNHAVMRQNGQDIACGDTEPCADVGAVRPPNLRASTCDVSMQVPEEFSGPIPFGAPWGVCSND